MASSESPLSKLTDNVLALRARSNWTTRALSEHSGVDRGTLARLEHGKVEKISVATVDRLAKGLGVRTGSLFGNRPVARREGESEIDAVLSENLVKARARLGWTQEELSARSGVGRDFIAHIERRATSLSVENLARLAEATGITAERLLSESRGKSVED